MGAVFCWKAFWGTNRNSVLDENNVSFPFKIGFIPFVFLRTKKNRYRKVVQKKLNQGGIFTVLKAKRR